MGLSRGQASTYLSGSEKFDHGICGYPKMPGKRNHT